MTFKLGGMRGDRVLDEVIQAKQFGPLPPRNAHRVEHTDALVDALHLGAKGRDLAPETIGHIGVLKLFKRPQSRFR
ncbi:hypothetical protein D3C87_1835520 [compost metagenome]